MLHGKGSASFGLCLVVSQITRAFSSHLLWPEEGALGRQGVFHKALPRLQHRSEVIFTSLFRKTLAVKVFGVNPFH